MKKLLDVVMIIIFIATSTIHISALAMKILTCPQIGQPQIMTNNQLPQNLVEKASILWQAHIEELHHSASLSGFLETINPIHVFSICESDQNNKCICYALTTDESDTIALLKWLESEPSINTVRVNKPNDYFLGMNATATTSTIQAIIHLANARPDIQYKELNITGWLEDEIEKLIDALENNYTITLESELVFPKCSTDSCIPISKHLPRYRSIIRRNLAAIADTSIFAADLQTILYDNDVSAETLTKASQNPAMSEHYAILAVCHRSCDINVLRAVTFFHPTTLTIAEVARHPKSDGRLLLAIAQNPIIDAKSLEYITIHPNVTAEVLTVVASHPNASYNALMKIVLCPVTDINGLQAVLIHSQAQHDEILLQIPRHPAADINIARAVFAHPKVNIPFLDNVIAQRDEAKAQTVQQNNFIINFLKQFNDYQ